MLGSYGYSEIRLPIVEQTPLFKRAIGEVTDVVEKEMYTFEDRNGDSLTLRSLKGRRAVYAPASSMVFCTIRNSVCGISGRCSVTSVRRKGVIVSSISWAAKFFGLQGPDIDAELIMLTARWWRALGISEHVTLELNSIGSAGSTRQLPRCAGGIP